LFLHLNRYLMQPQCNYMQASYRMLILTTVQLRGGLDWPTSKLKVGIIDCFEFITSVVIAWLHFILLAVNTLNQGPNHGGGGAIRPLPRDGVWRNSTEIQQSGHAPRSGPEVKNGRNSAEDDAPERLGCGTVKEALFTVAKKDEAPPPLS